MGQSIIKNPRKVVSQLGGGGTDAALTTRVEYLEDNIYKVTYFTEINGTTGTITKPTGSTILTDQFFGGVDAYVSTISNGQPTGIFPQTAGGVEVDVTSFNTAGDFVLNGTPSAYPCALIYKISIAAVNWQNLTTANILDLEDMNALIRSNNLSDLISAKTARVNIGQDKQTNGGNAAYSILATDKVVYTGTAFTGARIWTLPDASTVNSGYEIIVADYLQTVTSTNTITIAVQTGQSLNNVVNGTEVMSSAGTWRRLISDGSSNWTFDNGIARLGKTQTFSGINTFTNAINSAQGADIASASTTNIGAATGNYVKVTGTTTITALGTIQAGTIRIVTFTGALTLTHNATSLILPGAANILTVAGDVVGFVSEGSGNWRCFYYNRGGFNPTYLDATSSIQTQLNSKGYVVASRYYATINPTDSTTYYTSYVFASNLTTSGASTKHKALKSGTSINVAWTHTVVAGSNEGVTLKVTNLTTAVTITIATNIDMSNANVNSSWLAQALTYTAGDLIEVTIETPAWVTNPTSVRFNVDLHLV